MLRLICLSDAHIRYLFPSSVPVKMDFSSVPKFLLVFNYPDWRDTEVNDIPVGSLECSYFWFRVKILPLTTVFSMLEESSIWWGVFPYGAVELYVCVVRLSLSFYVHIPLQIVNHLHVLQEFCIFYSSHGFSLYIFLFSFSGSAHTKVL